MKFKKTKVMLKRYHDNIEMDGWQVGDWAYHLQKFAEKSGPFFSITHVPTGMCVERSLEKKQVRKLTKLLAENVSEWHPSEKMLADCINRHRWPKKFRQECTKTLNDFLKGGE